MLAQTLVRVLGAGHGPANAVSAPAHDRRARAAGSRRELAAFHDAAALATKVHVAALATKVRASAIAGATSLTELGLDTSRLDEAADAAAARPQLANTPPAADRDEILALYEAAR